MQRHVLARFQFSFRSLRLSAKLCENFSLEGLVGGTGEEHCEKVPELWAGQPRGSRLEVTEELVDKQLLH